MGENIYVMYLKRDFYLKCINLTQLNHQRKNSLIFKMGESSEYSFISKNVIEITNKHIKR